MGQSSKTRHLAATGRASFTPAQPLPLSGEGARDNILSLTAHEVRQLPPSTNGTRRSIDSMIQDNTDHRKSASSASESGDQTPRKTATDAAATDDHSDHSDGGDGSDGSDSSDAAPGAPLTLLRRLHSFPLFKLAPESFFKAIALRLQLVQLNAHEYIVKAGEPLRAMYWILKGSAGVLLPDGEAFSAELTAGNFFGEIGILYNRPRTATVVLRTQVLLGVLTADVLNLVLPQYPKVERRIRDEALERLSMQNKRRDMLLPVALPSSSRRGSIFQDQNTKQSIDGSANETNGMLALKVASAAEQLPGPLLPPLTQTSTEDSLQASYSRHHLLAFQLPLFLYPLVDHSLPTRDFLQLLSIFQLLPASMMHQLVLDAEPCSLAPFEYVVRKGDEGCDMYFIVAGEVEVVDVRENPADPVPPPRRMLLVPSGTDTLLPLVQLLLNLPAPQQAVPEPGPVMETRLARLGAGQYFGEMAFLEQLANGGKATKRSASIRTISDVEMIVVNGSKWSTLVEQNPKIYDEMRQTALERIAANKHDPWTQANGLTALNAMLSLKRSASSEPDFEPRELQQPDSSTPADPLARAILSPCPVPATQPVFRSPRGPVLRGTLPEALSLAAERTSPAAMDPSPLSAFKLWQHDRHISLALPHQVAPVLSNQLPVLGAAASTLLTPPTPPALSAPSRNQAPGPGVILFNEHVFGASKLLLRQGDRLVLPPTASSAGATAPHLRHASPGFQRLRHASPENIDLVVPPLDPVVPLLNHFGSNNQMAAGEQLFHYMPRAKRIRLASVLGPGARRRLLVLNVGPLPDRLLLQVFQFLKLPVLMRMAQVCRRWRQLLYVAPSLFRVLDLTEWNLLIDDNALRQIVRFTGLRPQVIDILNCFHITGDGFLNLVTEIGMGGCIKVMRMRLVWDVSAMAIMDLAVPLVGRCLEELDLSNCRRVRDDVIERLVGWGDNPPPSTDVQDEREYAEDSIPEMALFDGVVSSHSRGVVGCANLKRLNLAYCKHLTDRTAYHLAMYANQNLALLNLTRCTSITDAGFAYWAYQSFPNLTHLGLGDCTFLTDKAIILIASSTKNLRHLDLLFCCSLSDVAVEVLLLGCPQLQELNLLFCGLAVSDALMATILLHLWHLRQLLIKGCVRVTRAGVDALLSGNCSLDYLDILQCRNAHVYPGGVAAQALNMVLGSRSALVLAGQNGQVTEIAL